MPDCGGGPIEQGHDMAEVGTGAEESAAQRSRSYHILDILRGIAAMSVVVLHFPQAFAPIAAPGAYLAVDLFFAMSGFVLANAYDAKLAGEMNAGAFLRARVIRLLPFYLVALLLSTIELAYFYRHDGLGMAVALSTVLTFFMVPVPPVGFPDNPLFPGNFVAWTLAFELLANIIYAVSVSRLSSQKLAIGVGASGAAVAAIAIVRGNLNGGAYWPDVHLAVLRMLFSFFLGVLVFRARATGRLPAISIPAIVPIGIATLALAWPVPASVRGAADAVVVLAIFPLVLIAATARAPRFSRRIDRLLGDVSYPIYVLQIPVFSALVLGAARLSPHLLQASAPWIGVAVLAALCAGSWLLAQRWEVPLRRRLSIWAGRAFGSEPDRQPSQRTGQRPTGP